MGYIQMGVPQSLVLRFIRAHNIPNFIETGTFKGGTTLWAAKHFQKVITLEINPEFSRAVAERPDCPKNIQFLVGDSAKLLREVVNGLSGQGVFWLDGHYCGPGTGDATAECPIMEELEALRSAEDPIILIDDARCFLGPPPPPHDPRHWVSIDEIYRYLIVHFPNHMTTVHDDVIISIPKVLKPQLDEDWLSHFDERFSYQLTKPSLGRRIINKVFRILNVKIA